MKNKLVLPIIILVGCLLAGYTGCSFPFSGGYEAIPSDINLFANLEVVKEKNHNHEER
ncbi:MAG: hypothetical protein MJ119_06760 [Lachnospiraceae bacterium]|nr:hypothetical protein [Lachnospiraceae bacterium]